MTDALEKELDSIDPQPKKMMVRGKEVTIHPPRLIVFMRLQRAFARISGEELDKMTDEEFEAIEAKVTAWVIMCIPELFGLTLTSGELMTLTMEIMALGTPKLDSELKKRGIEVDSSKKAS